jgi:hypothetical protein
MAMLSKHAPGVPTCLRAPGAGGVGVEPACTTHGISMRVELHSQTAPASMQASSAVAWCKVRMQAARCAQQLFLQVHSCWSACTLQHLRLGLHRHDKRSLPRDICLSYGHIAHAGCWRSAATLVCQVSTPWPRILPRARKPQLLQAPCLPHGRCLRHQEISRQVHLAHDMGYYPCCDGLLAA